MESIQVIEAQNLSIYEVTRLIDRQISTPNLQNIAIVGEITKYTRTPSSGHVYFTLEDKDSANKNNQKKAILNCTLWNHFNERIGFQPKVGDEVQAVGSISLYYPRGQYNFNARSLRKLGAGNLLIKIQELRQKLMLEGIIDPTLRKPLPRLPLKIGIVTGARTAAIKDIIKQIKDRYPHVNALISPAIMQGEESADSISAALDEIGREEYGCDLVILSRGGGSPEDLMSLSDERVARAIFACPIPVISGIGHEIDHPVSDDVADVQAATPTDAAKIALPIVNDLLLSLAGAAVRLDQNINMRLKLNKEKLKRLLEKKIFLEPESLLQDAYRKLDEIEIRMSEAFREKIKSFADSLKKLPDLSSLCGNIFAERQNQYIRLKEKLLAFSPIATLKRGYSLTYQNGNLLRSVNSLNKKQNIEVKLHDGSFTAAPPLDGKCSKSGAPPHKFAYKSQTFARKITHF